MTSPWVKRAMAGTLPSKSDDAFVPTGHEEARPQTYIADPDLWSDDVDAGDLDDLCDLDEEDYDA